MLSGIFYAESFQEARWEDFMGVGMSSIGRKEERLRIEI
jgi:hypothetical protein